MTDLATQRPKATRRPWWAFVAIVVLLLAAWFLLTDGERRRSHTADEPNHLVRGIAYWQTGAARLSYPHPPLANALATFPLRNESERIDVTSLRGWKPNDAQRLSGSYFMEDFAAARDELSVARRSIALFTVAFAAYFAWWCWCRWGPIVAVLALALFVGHPTILAHGSLMTTDMPAAAFAFLALTQFCEYLDGRRRYALLAFASASALLLATKHSGVPIVFILAAIALVHAWRRSARFAGLASRRRAVLRWALEMFLVVLCSGVVINAVYRFQETGMTVREIEDVPEPSNWITQRLPGELIDIPDMVPDGLRVPLPYPYVLGLATIRGQNQVGHAGYFAGVYSKRNPAYFTVLTLMKTPAGILALLGLAGVFVYRRSLAVTRSAWVLVAFGIIYVGLASTAKINIGVRHVLPVFPLLVAFGARAAVWLWKRWEGRAAWRAGVVLAVMSASLAAPVARPHYLGHFNVLVGGPWGGHKISMIGEDWGQDMVDVAERLAGESRPVWYYTIWAPRPLEMEHLGIRVHRFKCEEIPPAGSVVVLHRTDLLRNGVRCFFWLDACEREAVINHHVELHSCPDEAALEPMRAQMAARNASLTEGEAAAGSE